jgi:ribonuclease D
MPLINQPDALAQLVERASRVPVVAIDTEFVWERTYYPHLGLVQVGLGQDDVYLLDAQALDLEPLGALLADSSVVKVLHDAIQDLTILRRATGSDPTNVFDSQVAGGFVGLTATASLQGLIAETTGRQLDKGATRSDWLARPLSEVQLEYARDDVRYLPAAYDELRRRLEDLGRMAWAEEEMQALEEAALYGEADPQERYTAVRGKSKRGFSGRDYAVLRELAAWRELEARRLNRPRGHVVPDDALMEVALRKPESVDQFGRIKTLSARAAERFGAALVDAVRRGLDAPRETWPEKNARKPDDATLTPRLDLVQALIRGRSEREGVDPILIANRADVERLVADRPPDPDRHRVLTGWRREFIGADLEALLAGRAAVALDDQGLPQFVTLATEAL